MIARSVLVFWLAFQVGTAVGDDLRLNQIQVIGTHNSYHIAPHPNVVGLLGATSREASQALDYTHRPLAEQFTLLGVRQVELDVFADPEGGRYADPPVRKLLKGLGRDPGPAPDPEGKLRQPGFKVLHIQDIDYRSTVPTLADALRQIRDWSVAHPGHVPILVLVELKDEVIAALPTRPAAIGPAEMDAVDAAIRSVFGPSHFLEPDDVRKSHDTLSGAIRAEGWPRLDDVRGQVLFALDNEGARRDLYLSDHPSLRGRAMFVSVEPDHPAAAWMKVNDPIRDFDRIRDLVRKGFLVRTRADAETAEARGNDSFRRDKALASGAQFVSTDFPEARLDFSPYRVRLPGGVVARANPVNGPPDPQGIDRESSADR